VYRKKETTFIVVIDLK